MTTYSKNREIYKANKVAIQAAVRRTIRAKYAAKAKA